MQFRPQIEKITLDYDIYAIKGAADFYLSLSDIVDTLNFPITIVKEEQRAEGWFLREDWRFNLDIKAGLAESRGRFYDLAADDYKVIDGDIYIAGKIIGALLAMDFEYDISQQYLNIETEYPLPIVAQIKRRKNIRGDGVDQNIAKLPRKDYDYDMFNLTTADLSLRTNYKREGDTGKSALLNRTDIAIAGDVLKHDAYMFVMADDREGLNAITGRLSRVSNAPEMLGPLKARSYSLGDVNTVSVPLTGFASQELGARVSNNPLSGINFQNTSITGNAVPGWDVELYRGNTRVDIVTVDEAGRYEFANVQLYAGNNEFDILFYGDQGEIRRESLSIPLTEASLLAQASTYDVSVSLNEKATYRRQESEDEDVGTPNVSGQYNFFMGDALAYAGARAVQEEGEQKFYLGSGLTSIWNKFIIDINLAADNNAEAGARLGIRRNIADWNLALSTETASEEFTAGNSGMPQTFGLFGSAQKTYIPFFGISGNVFLNGNYREYADGGTSSTASIGVGQGFTGVSLSNTLLYDRAEPAGAVATDRFINSFSARARLSGKASLRAGVDYKIRPESRMERYVASLNYRPSRLLTMDFEAEHRPENHYSEGEIRANYLHEKFRLSPFVRYDSDRDLTTGFNVTTSLVDTPYELMPLVTSERLIGHGQVSAKVYLDVNGNQIFDEGDEVLPEVVVESLNSRQREETNEEGYALLKKLSVNVVTDIRVDNSTLPDPFMISVHKGNSVLPRAGKIFEMEFPIQFSGEVDGTIAISDEGGDSELAKFVTAELIPLDPIRNDTVSAKGAQDGFYLLSQVPPGQYFLTVSAADAKVLKSARPMPQIMTFTHEGTSFYAQDIVLQRGRHDIGFAVLTTGAFGDFGNAEPEYFISIGDRKASGPLQALYRFRMKSIIHQVVAGLTSIKKEGDTYYRLGPGGLEAAYGRCQIMSSHKLPCSVAVLPAEAVPAASTLLSKQAAL